MRFPHNDPRGFACHRLFQHEVIGSRYEREIGLADACAFRLNVTESSKSMQVRRELQRLGSVQFEIASFTFSTTFATAVHAASTPASWLSGLFRSPILRSASAAGLSC